MAKVIDCARIGEMKVIFDNGKMQVALFDDAGGNVMAHISNNEGECMLVHYDALAEFCAELVVKANDTGDVQKILAMGKALEVH